MRIVSTVDYIEDAAGCWVWQRGKSSTGYGQIYIEGTRKPQRAHRVYYQRFRGAIPDGLDLDHLCRNRACVNPDHLEPVTHAENMRRGEVWKRRWPTHPDATTTQE